MAYPLRGGWRVAGSWLPALTAILSDSLAILMAVLALFAGGLTSRGEDLPQSVILDFTATWCQPCREMNPIVHRLAQQGYAIRKVDVDKQPNLARSYRIGTIPTFVLVIDGEERTRVSGKISEEQLRRMAQQIGKQSSPPTAPAGKTPEKPSIPLPKTPQENPTVDDEVVTPFADSLGEPKAVPLPNPAPLADTGKRNGLLEKLKFPKFASKKDKAEVAEKNRHGEIPRFRGKASDIEDSPHDAAPREPLAASVRIRVSDETGANLGSGTIIDSRVGRTTIITCGHIFGSKSTPENAPVSPKKVEVDLFLPDGRHETYVGKLLDYDLDGDVGVVTIATAGTLPTTPVAPLAEVPVLNASLISIGCGGGETPVEETVRVTDVNRYDGPENLECTGVPVQGRSGGGLFDAHGQIVGVCIAADQEGRRGVYAGLRPVFDLLTRAGLEQMLPVTPAANAQEKSNEPAAEVAKAKPLTGSPSATDKNFDDAFRDLDRDLFAGDATPTSAELAHIFEDAPDAEVICIVRPKQGGASRVVILNQASTKFVGYLLDSVDTQRSSAPQNASLRVEDPQDRLGGEWISDDSIGVPKHAADESRDLRLAKTKPTSKNSPRRSRFGSRAAN